MSHEFFLFDLVTMCTCHRMILTFCYSAADGRTDGRIKGRGDGATDTASFHGAKPHQKDSSLLTELAGVGMREKRLEQRPRDE